MNATDYWKAKWLPMLEAMIKRFEVQAPHARVAILRNASHYLFRDREADVVREMKVFYRK